MVQENFWFHRGRLGHFLMKQPYLGEYSDTCLYADYVVDSEFSRQREPFVASCDSLGASKSWLVNNRFKTLWGLGVW